LLATREKTKQNKKHFSNSPFRENSEFYLNKFVWHLRSNLRRFETFLQFFTQIL